jgi:hypothetical protein
MMATAKSAFTLDASRSRCQRDGVKVDPSIYGVALKMRSVRGPVNETRWDSQSFIERTVI